MSLTVRSAAAAEADGRADDSGNSSSSNASSVILSLERLNANTTGTSLCDDENDVEGVASASTSSSLQRLLLTVAAADNDDSSTISSSQLQLWQPDYSLYHSGYELADFTDPASGLDVLLPLHKTVCCALCRFVGSTLSVCITESLRFLRSGS